MPNNLRRVQSQPTLPSRASNHATLVADTDPDRLAVSPPVSPTSTQDAHEGQSQTPSLPVKILTYFGMGSRATHARRSLVSVIWNIFGAFIQVIVITVLLILVSLHFKSPLNPGLSEWAACGKPLGIWAALWLVRVILASGMAYWEFKRDRILYPPESDAENANATATTPGANNSVNPPQQPPRRRGPAVDPQTLPYSVLYARLTLLSSLITISWFLTANILQYTSLNTCRYAAPHLWWLVFGILCIIYLMVLEIVVLGFVVLVVAPILFIFWNIFLICIGRHPMQNPNTIKPEVGKLSKSVVNQIPLVMYIPSPPTDENSAESTTQQMPHIYPPKSKVTRFKILPNIPFFKFGSSKREKTEGETPSGDSWANLWESVEYPFITLEGNRASCAICITDFVEPKRLASKKVTVERKQEEKLTPSAETSPDNLPGSSVEVEQRQAEEPSKLKLNDAGEGPQPLRLLGCGHVFHKTCIDPWLIDVSGRCPVCQRPVEAPKRDKARRPAGTTVTPP